MLGCLTSLDGGASPRLERRVRRAIELWKNAPELMFVCTGGASRGGVTEAGACGALAVELGVPHERLLLEESASSTWENAVNTRALLGDVPVVVVTDPFHRFRTARVFRRFFKTVSVEVTTEPTPLPFKLRLREAGAIVSYGFKGRL